MFIKLSVRAKIYLIAAIGSLGFILYLWLNFSQGEEMQSRLIDLEKQQLPVLMSINNASLNMLQLKDFLSVAISSSEESMVENAEKHNVEIVKELTKIIDFNNKYSKQSEALLSSHRKYWSSAKGLALGMLNQTINYDKLAELSQNMNKNFKTVNTGLANLRKTVIKEFGETVANINTKNTSALKFGFFLGITLIALLLLITYFVSNNITRSINRVTSSLNLIASGKADLTRRLSIENNDEVGRLVTSFNSFIGSMERLIAQTISVSRKVSSQAVSLHSIATETHQGIVDQQQEIQLVATAVTELSASSSEVYSNADSASELTQKANDETSRSYVIIKENRETINSLANEVSRAADVIDQLHSKTNSIGSMVDVIRGIADQTNLLALNAAIEAARAGEQGRGFAVVADEVRSLANSTQESTLEIENLIKALQSDAVEAVGVMKKGSTQASDSVEQSNLVEQALDSISQFVSDINDRSIQVSTASKEQSQVSDELSHNIVSINEVADKTVAKANQTIQTSEDLHNLADKLDVLISQFKVGDIDTSEDVSLF